MPVSLGSCRARRARRSERATSIVALLVLSLPACTLGAQRGSTEGPLPMDSGTRVEVRRLADSLGSILDAAVRDSAFPGAIAIIGTKEGVLVERTAGHLDWAPSPAPDASTLWDLASLTKVVALTSATMKLVEQRRVDLDAPVQRYLPEWTGPNKERVTVRHLLTHSAGLPAWRPLYKEAQSPQGAVALALATPLDTLPGVRMVYSDLGAIIMGQLVARVSGMPFERFVHEQIFAPAKMTDTRFLPPSEWKARIAPTEIDPWRGRHLRGEVHDENAHALGGVSSHAGLFSTARDLSRFARMYLNGGALDGVRIFDSTTIALFTRVQNTALSHRALGWETPNGSNSGGTRMSCAAFGHTGFTGTSIWMDPTRNLFVLLLTNRVNPTRERRAISSVRVAVADAAMGLMTAGLAQSETPSDRQSSENRTDRVTTGGVRGCQN